MSAKIEEIYEMGLHDTVFLSEDMSILRVPGGWIYTFGIDDNVTSVFVPFSNEFVRSML